MPDQYKDQLDVLSISVAEMKVELLGIKEVLSRISNNQFEIIRLRELSNGFIKNFKEAKDDHKNLSQAIRDIQDIRSGPRLDKVEVNFRWLTTSFIVGTVSIVCSLLVRMFMQVK